jgi:hypothetical protein
MKFVAFVSRKYRSEVLNLYMPESQIVERVPIGEGE